MSKKSKRRVNSPAIIQNIIPEIIETKISNGFSEAIGIGGGGINFGFPGNQGWPGSEQLSQPTTIFKNLRWYLISNDRQMLSEAYVEIGLIQKICKLPVADALRGGIEIKSEELGEDNIKELLVSLDRDDDINTVGQSEVWNRLYGGAGILILTDQDPEEPLDLSSIGPDTPLEFRAVDMWELFWNKQGTEGYDVTTQTHDFEFYTYYSEPVHKSRVMRMIGLTAPSFVRPRLRGWGFSVVEILVRSINQYLKATDLSFEVLDEFKVDVFKMKNLINTLMSPQGESQVMKRVQLAALQKNYQNALVMDSEDDWDHKQLSFSGLAETMEGIRIQVASDMSMPMIKLFGTPASGLNAGDEDSIEVYNAMVESEIRNKLKYPILRILEIKCQKMFGFIPKDLAVTFKPLRVMSAIDEETVKKEKFNRLIQLFEAGVISAEQFRDGCNRGNILDITLDPEGGLTGYRADTIKEGKNDPYKPKPGSNDPGANRVDTAKSKATETGGISKEPVNKPTVPSKAQSDNILKARRRENSLKFDEKSYAADGGDSWIDARKKPFYEDPQGVNKAQWEEAKTRSKEIYGKENWAFTLWFYKKIGGLIT